MSLSFKQQTKNIAFIDVSLQFKDWSILTIYTEDSKNCVCGCLLETNKNNNKHNGVYYDLEKDIFKIVIQGRVDFDNPLSIIEIIKYLKDKTNCTTEMLQAFFNRITTLQKGK